MEIVFYGFYWIFCVIRLAMTSSFGNPQYGSFINGDGIMQGLFGTTCWIVGIVIIFLIFAGILAAIGGLASLGEDEKKS